uniref:Reverse transcriptase domain-containing protein n=1 Tax=Tanacetum cinerariifolium TaxID=118510 RepID=A0A6L2J3X7_TANCI|nr:hypothetical protein [Tanacetum cinerariifolium]
MSDWEALNEQAAKLSQVLKQFERQILYGQYSCSCCEAPQNGENCPRCSMVGSGNRNHLVYEPTPGNNYDFPCFDQPPQYHIDQSPPQDLDFEREPEGSDDYTEVPFNNEKIIRQHNIAQVTPPAYTPSLPFLTTMEPTNTLLMGDEVINTILAREIDEFIKSSVEDLVPVPRESEVTSDSNLECDMPVNTLLLATDVREENFDINSPLGEYVVDFSMEKVDVADLPRHLVKELFSHLVKNPSLTKKMSDEPLGDDSKPRSYDVTFSNPFFDFNDDFTLCNDNPLFDEEFDDISSLDPPKSEPLNHEPLGNPDSMSRSLETSDLILEELTTEIGLDDSIPTQIDDGYYDSEGDILFLEYLLIEETFSNRTPVVLPKKSTLLIQQPPASKQFSLREVERFDPFFSLTQLGGKTRVMKTPSFGFHHMLDDSWKSRMELYMQNREHGRMILESVENDPLIWPTIEENGVTRTKKYAKLSAAEKIQADCDMKATYIILQGERIKFVTGVKLMKDLHTTNFDQLHAYLEQHELHANDVCLRHERNQDPLAFVTNRQMTSPHFNTYQSSYNNPQLQQHFSPSQYGSIHPNQHYSPTYPSPPQFNHSSVPSSYPHQSQMNHQTSSVPQIAYQSPQVTTQPMIESALIDSGFAIPVFSPGDDLIACLNKAMAFLTAVASLRNVAWYKEKAMLDEAQEAGQILDEEQLAFLTDPGVQDGQAIQKITPNNAAFQTEDLDTYDSDCDDISNAQAVFMANISNYASNVILEVPHSETYLNDMENQSVHAMQDFEQTSAVDVSNNEIHSDSNIIPYSQYLEETQQANVQDTHLQAQQDSMILSVIEQMSE